MQDKLRQVGVAPGEQGLSGLVEHRAQRLGVGDQRSRPVHGDP